MPHIHKRRKANTDLEEIWHYIAADSVTHADSLLRMLDEKFNLLAERPHIGRAREELAAGLRSFPVGKYIIFFRPLPDGIEVVRVLHSARDRMTGSFTENV